MAKPTTASPGAAPESVPAPPRDPAPAWSQAQRISFRFLFCYAAIYVLPNVLGILPATEPFAAPFFGLWQPLLPWAARELLHLRAPMAVLPDGGGDSTTGAVFLFCMVACAAVAALVWTLLDRRSRHYRRLHAGLRVYIRYSLGIVLLHYGISKLIKTQFAFPPPFRLGEVYGDASPMGLLWTFMGYSTPYNVFCGLVEAGAGFLLLFRRTATAGALLAVAGMANVVAIDFSYDVHVKHLASHLLLMGVFLLAPDLRRLANLLILNRPTEAAPLPPRRREPRWFDLSLRTLKALFISFLLIAFTKERFDIWKSFDAIEAHRKRSAAPIYAIDGFARNGRSVPGCPTDPGRWLRFAFNPPEATVVLGTGDVLAGDYDPRTQMLLLSSEDRKRRLGQLALTRPGGETMVLTGRLGNDTLAVTIGKFYPTRALLVTRGFHWINDAPFDR